MQSFFEIMCRRKKSRVAFLVFQSHYSQASSSESVHPWSPTGHGFFHYILQSNSSLHDISPSRITNKKSENSACRKWTNQEKSKSFWFKCFLGKRCKPKQNSRQRCFQWLCIIWHNYLYIFQGRQFRKKVLTKSRCNSGLPLKAHHAVKKKQKKNTKFGIAGWKKKQGDFTVRVGQNVRIWFARTSLTVGKKAGVKSFKGPEEQRFSQSFIHRLLAGKRRIAVVHRAEREVVCERKALFGVRMLDKSILATCEDDLQCLLGLLPTNQSRNG